MKQRNYLHVDNSRPTLMAFCASEHFCTLCAASRGFSATFFPFLLFIKIVRTCTERLTANSVVWTMQSGMRMHKICSSYLDVCLSVCLSMCMCVCVSVGSDVVVRTGVQGRLGQHHVYRTRCSRHRSTGMSYVICT